MGLMCKPPSTRTLQPKELAEVVQGADTPRPAAQHGEQYLGFIGVDLSQIVNIACMRY